MSEVLLINVLLTYLTSLKLVTDRKVWEPKIKLANITHNRLKKKIKKETKSLYQLKQFSQTHFSKSRALPKPENLASVSTQSVELATQSLLGNRAIRKHRARTTLGLCHFVGAFWVSNFANCKTLLVLLLCW